MFSQGEGVTIAILDSGVDYFHPAISGNIKINQGEIPDNGLDDDNNGYVDDYTGYDFYNDDPHPYDDVGHGTSVAGQAASAIGMAPKTKILPVKVSSFGMFDAGRIAQGIRYAIDSGADIISIYFSRRIPR